MKRYALPVSVLVLFTFALLSFAEDVKKQELPLPKNVPQYLQDIAVTIRAGRYEGSGVLRQVKNGDTYVFTCGHVLSDLRHTREEVSEAGKKSVVEFDDAKIIQIVVEDGRIVGEHNFSAEVIRYSNAEHGEDLAILKLRSSKFKPMASVVFYLSKEIPPVGSDLCHIGSSHGQFGHNSYGVGVMSYVGRIYQGKIYDQCSVNSSGGASGSGVYLKDGRYVGTLVRGSGETFNFIVPIRRIHSWAKKTKVEWILDDNIPVPSYEEIMKTPIEDSAGNSNNHNKSHHRFKFLIRDRNVLNSDLFMPTIPD